MWKIFILSQGPQHMPSSRLAPYLQCRLDICYVLAACGIFDNNILVGIDSLFGQIFLSIVTLYFCIPCAATPPSKSPCSQSVRTSKLQFSDFDWLDPQASQNLRSVMILFGSWAMDAYKGVVEILRRVACPRMSVAVPLDHGVSKIIRHLKALRPVLDSFAHLDRLAFGYPSHTDIPPNSPTDSRDAAKKHMKEYDERRIPEWQMVFGAEPVFRHMFSSVALFLDRQTRRNAFAIGRSEGGAATEARSRDDSCHTKRAGAFDIPLAHCIHALDGRGTLGSSARDAVKRTTVCKKFGLPEIIVETAEFRAAFGSPNCAPALESKAPLPRQAA
ncbi:hypothetical protein PHLGIDRAFT_284394 [Phlebiopsis gigantea 11061_1 CR5-6]|uniref:Uncharacterized protein n=1 Tax=Phlebiopsis gigantea (strain 11061_1 CR5-6) TaxID=745531 RepID=A0A0C3PC88_PHLG1|nr:hypothetical protein PHLGIDRAFT_284394 [Phlebiopsis gigantea 11061_1 CR5-6]